METLTLSQKVEALEEECEERSRQANSWYHALQVGGVWRVTVVVVGRERERGVELFGQCRRWDVCHGPDFRVHKTFLEAGTATIHTTSHHMYA